MITRKEELGEMIGSNKTELEQPVAVEVKQITVQVESWENDTWPRTASYYDLKDRDDKHDIMKCAAFMVAETYDYVPAGIENEELVCENDEILFSADIPVVSLETAREQNLPLGLSSEVLPEDEEDERVIIADKVAVGSSYPYVKLVHVQIHIAEKDPVYRDLNTRPDSEIQAIMQDAAFIAAARNRYLPCEIRSEEYSHSEGIKYEADILVR